MVFENILNPIFFPLLSLPTLWAVIILSFLISLIITIIYKYTTDQNLMKQLKEEMKEFQKEMGTQEFYHHLGKVLNGCEDNKKLGEVSVLACAYRCGIPVFTSSLK